MVEDNFGFIPGKGTTAAMQVIDKHREMQKELHINKALLSLSSKRIGMFVCILYTGRHACTNVMSM